MNKKIIALSVFFILGISCFTIVSIDNKDNNDEKIIEHIETYGISKKLTDKKDIDVKYLYENIKPYIHKAIEVNN